MTTLLDCLIEIADPNDPHRDGAVWIVTREERVLVMLPDGPGYQLYMKLHHNEFGSRRCRAANLDGDSITLSHCDDEGREVILCGEIVNRPTEEKTDV